MCPGKRVAALALAVLALAGALTGAAQDANEALDADACVAAAVADWSLPQTLEDVTALQEALAELVAGCGVDAGAVDETESAAEEMSDAEGDFPRRMYVTSRVPRINVRREPSTSSEVVATLAFAAPVEVLARVEGESYRENAWWYGTEGGYIHSLLLGETKPAPLPTPTPVPVTEPQDSQSSAQQEQRQQQQGGRQRQAAQPRQQPGTDDKPPPDETKTPPDDTGKTPRVTFIVEEFSDEDWDEVDRQRGEEGDGE